MLAPLADGRVTRNDLETVETALESLEPGVGSGGLQRLDLGDGFRVEGVDRAYEANGRRKARIVVVAGRGTRTGCSCGSQNRPEAWLANHLESYFRSPSKCGA